MMHLHINQKSDYDDMIEKDNQSRLQNFLTSLHANNARAYFKYWAVKTHGQRGWEHHDLTSYAHRILCKK